MDENGTVTANWHCSTFWQFTFFQALILLQRLYKQAMFDIAGMLLYALIATVQCLVMV